MKPSYTIQNKKISLRFFTEMCSPLRHPFYQEKIKYQMVNHCYPDQPKEHAFSAVDLPIIWVTIQ